jgi:hypothetical protein
VCDDANHCTDDSCDSSAGCAFVDNTSPCDDGDLCTTGDVCGGGACTATPVACDDGNVCNGSETCDSGTGGCVSTGPLVCDDGNACTNDSCDPLAGCVFTNNTNPCDDSNLCTTGDVCGGGTCNGAPVLCDDGNLCNGDETCNPGTGACVSPGPLNCNDGNVCTDDSCNPLLGCVNANNTAPCNDGDTCTSGDVCGGGTCGGDTDVLCVLGALIDVIQDADPADLGGQRSALKFLRQALKAQVRVERALFGSPLSAEKNLRRAQRTLDRINTRVVKGLNRGKIDPAAGAQIQALTAQASAAIQELLTGP